MKRSTTTLPARIPGWLCDRHCDEEIPEHGAGWDWHSTRDGHDPTNHTPARVSATGTHDHTNTPFDQEAPDHAPAKAA